MVGAMPHDLSVCGLWQFYVSITVLTVFVTIKMQKPRLISFINNNSNLIPGTETLISVLMLTQFLISFLVYKDQHAVHVWCNAAPRFRRCLLRII